jgi:hypothetical protein
MRRGNESCDREGGTLALRTRERTARGELFDAEGGLRWHGREGEKRYPKVPVQAIALEPEQQGGTGPDI